MKKIAMFMGILILILSTVLFSGSINNGKSLPLEAEAREQPPDYLPYAEGNMWQYKITVPEGGDYYYQKTVSYEKEPSYRVTGRLLPDPGVYFLELEIQNKSEGVFWNVLVKEDSLGIYRDADSLSWGTWYSSDYRMQVERIIYDKYSPMGGMGGSNVWWREEGPMSTEPMMFEQARTSYLEISTEGISLRHIDKSTEVTVPAGHFRNCILSLREYEASEEPKSDYPVSLGWKTYSCYASNIGLIKEYQEDSEGHRLYTMELVDYKLEQKPTPTPIPTPSPTAPATEIPTSEEKWVPGFELIFTIAGLLAIAYLLRMRK